jgi:hypothetical protein
MRIGRHSLRRFAILGAAFLLVGIGRADTVTLKDGKTLTGRVVFEGPTKLVLRIGTKDREIPLDSIAEVRSVTRSLRDVLERWGKLAPDDAPGHMKLAHEARDEELEGEACVLAWSVLAKNAALGEAHEFLGHVEKGGHWLVKEGLRSVPYEKLLEERKDITDGWQLATTHFALRTNVPLDQACDALFELELGYQTFYDWFRPELGLFELTDVIHEQVHADRRSYAGGSGTPAFYDEASNTVFADMSGGFAIDRLLRETTRALLHGTAVRTKAALGSIPPWVNEGLADYMKFCRKGQLGHPSYVRGARGQALFSTHAAAQKPLDLARVLVLSAEDFMAPARSGLAYAQSYTLVHYCLHGDDERYRARFFEFLRQCYAGHSSVTDFKAALVVHEPEFENGWNAYAKQPK